MSLHALIERGLSIIGRELLETDMSQADIKKLKDEIASLVFDAVVESGTTVVDDWRYGG